MAMRLADLLLLLLTGRRSSRGRTRLAYDMLAALAESRRATARPRAF